MLDNKEFIVRFADGEYDSFVEYVLYFEDMSKDDLEYKILECKGELPNRDTFDTYTIYTLEEWKGQNKVELC